MTLLWCSRRSSGLTALLCSGRRRHSSNGNRDGVDHLSNTSAICRRVDPAPGSRHQDKSGRLHAVSAHDRQLVLPGRRLLPRSQALKLSEVVVEGPLVLAAVALNSNALPRTCNCSPPLAGTTTAPDIMTSQRLRS